MGNMTVDSPPAIYWNCAAGLNLIGPFGVVQAGRSDPAMY